MRTAPANLAMVRHVAERLGDLRERVVFLGGAATTLLITDPAAPDVRPTLDVDVIVEIGSGPDYYRLGQSLREIGFTEDASCAIHFIWTLNPILTGHLRDGISFCPCGLTKCPV